MGLDAVELVMEIEESFGIRFDEVELGSIRTAGEAYDCVMKELIDRSSAATLNTPNCATSSAFYKIRRALIEEFGLAREFIGPGTDLQKIVGSQDRTRGWERLGEALEIQLPELRRPHWLEEVGMVIALAVALVVAIPFALIHIALACLSFPFTFVATVLLLDRGTASFATIMPRSTVSDVVGEVVSKNFALIKDCREHQPDEIWFAMQGMIAEQLGVPRSAVTKTARFVEDLGAD